MINRKSVLLVLCIIVQGVISYFVLSHLGNNSINNIQLFSLCLFTVYGYISYKILVLDRVKETIKNFIIATLCINIFVVVDVFDFLKSNMYTTFKLITVFVITANLLKVVSAYLIDIKILNKIIIFFTILAILFESLDLGYAEIINYILYVIITFGPFVMAYKKRKILFEFGAKIYGVTFLFIASIFIYIFSGIFINNAKLEKLEIYFLLNSIYLTTLYFILLKKQNSSKVINKNEMLLMIIDCMFLCIFIVFVNLFGQGLRRVIYMGISLITIYKESMLMFCFYFEKQKDPNGVIRNKIQQYNIEKNYNKRISNFLHDDILQDIIAIKMNILLGEKEFLDESIKTIDKLIGITRSEIELYNPTIIYDLPLADNYYNLIESLRNRFNKNDILIDLNCDKEFFVNYPYDMVIYKILHELCINIYKHSKGNYSEINIKTDNRELYISVINHEDVFDYENIKIGNGRGLEIMKDEIEKLDGKILIDQFYDKVEPFIKINVTIPIEEEVICENIINR